MSGDPRTPALGGDRSPTASGSQRPVRGAAGLPRWPLAWLFVGLPLWWLLGVVDVVIVPIAFFMSLHLAARGRVRAPIGFGLWLVFLFFMLGSVVRLDQGSEYFTFGFRAAHYLSCTVVFLYVYNARDALPDRRVLGYLATYWATVIAGGVLGAAAPLGSLKTPMYFLLSKVAPGLASNDLVHLMVVRSFSQYDPDNYFAVPPRPSAPFLYTNNWGNLYSLLLPLVLVLVLMSGRGTLTRRVLVLLLPISVVPAMLTLNRGMMLGLGVAFLYAATRLALRGNGRMIGAMALLGLLAGSLWFLLPVQEGLATRTEASTTSRATLYELSLVAVSHSPFFGHGVTVDSPDPSAPDVGTQGQLWILLVSHGFVAVACFFGFFLVVLLRSITRHDPVGLACSTAVLIGTLELTFYGAVPYGLPVLMTVAALACRGPVPDAVVRRT